MSRLFLNVCFLFVASYCIGQQPVEMADVLRESGKIYVVVAILLIILIGLIVYIFRMDIKIRQIEKRK